MNAEQAPDTDTPPDVQPTEQPVTDDLVIEDWIEAGDPSLEGTFGRTVGDARRVFEDWYSRIALSEQFCPLVFVANSGRVYTANVGMVVRLATLDEVREAVENAKDDERDRLEYRIEELDGYLGESGA